MNKWAKYFWYLFLIDSITPLFTLLSYFIPGIREYSKIPVILLFMFFVFFHLFNKLILTRITKLLFISFIIAFTLSLVWNNKSMDIKIISQIYGILMPIFSVSFGIHYAKNNGIKIYPFINNIFKVYILVNIVLLLTYFYFHYVVNSITYFGFQVNWQIISAYLISQKKILLFFLGIIFVILSGKRATLITSLIPFLSYYKYIMKLDFKKKFILSVMILLITYNITNYLIDEGFFRRYEALLNFDITDSRVTFLATSGRWQEIESVFMHMNNRPISWLIGNGFGDKYLSVINVSGFEYQQELKHYVHFTPASYIFVHGIPITILIFALILRLIVLGWKKCHLNFFYLCFLVSIIGSFFGANLAVDPKIWFFYGVTFYIVNKK